MNKSTSPGHAAQRQASSWTGSKTCPDRRDGHLKLVDMLRELGVRGYANLR